MRRVRWGPKEQRKPDSLLYFVWCILLWACLRFSLTSALYEEETGSMNSAQTGSILVSWPYATYRIWQQTQMWPSYLIWKFHTKKGVSNECEVRFAEVGVQSPCDQQRAEWFPHVILGACQNMSRASFSLECGPKPPLFPEESNINW